jgi:hypothetical protein
VKSLLLSQESELFGALTTIDHKAELQPAERIRNSAGKVWEFLPVTARSRKQQQLMQSGSSGAQPTSAQQQQIKGRAKRPSNIGARKPTRVNSEKQQ